MERLPLYLNRNTIRAARFWWRIDMFRMPCNINAAGVACLRSHECICSRSHRFVMIGPKRRDHKAEREGGGGRDSSIYPRGCENASLIKSILGNRRCMNDGALVRGCVESGHPRKYELIGGITARSGAELPQYFMETFAVIPRGSLSTEQIEWSCPSQLTLEISDLFRSYSIGRVFRTEEV